MQQCQPASRIKNVVAWSLIIFLLIIHLFSSLGEAPTSMTAVAWMALTQWIPVAWGILGRFE
jgi:hypothetical protein